METRFVLAVNDKWVWKKLRHLLDLPCLTGSTHHFIIQIGSVNVECHKPNIISRYISNIFFIPQRDYIQTNAVRYGSGHHELPPPPLAQAVRVHRLVRNDNDNDKISIPLSHAQCEPDEVWNRIGYEGSRRAIRLLAKRENIGTEMERDLVSTQRKSLGR